MKKLKKAIKVIVCVIAIYCVLCPTALAVIHGIVMGRCDYDRYDSEHCLVYDDVKAEYPRTLLPFTSGENTLSAYLYGEENTKGLIVVAPGHTDANDIKLYEIMYFVNAGYSVICFDYTGYYTSEGKAFGGYTQAVHDLDALLCFIEDDDALSEKPLFLFGHSLGGYAVAAELNNSHNIQAVVSASGFDTPEEQWQYSIKRFTGVFYPIVKPFNTLFINLKYGDEKDLSAVDGISGTDIPVLVISTDDDIFYGGHSQIYNKREKIENPNCTFLLMDKENHNGHYDYFLTDEAVAYRASSPTGDVDKGLYSQHDEEVMQMIVDFYESRL